MTSLLKITLALMATAFIGTAPVMAAQETLPAGAAVQEKSEIGAQLKDKAAKVIDDAQTKTDKVADELKDALGAKKNQLSGQEVQVDQQTVTVETPSGVSSETVTTITPENPAPTTKK